MRFMPPSLSSLTNNLVKGGHHLSGFKDYSESQYELLICKGVYPYKLMTSWDKLDETSLPPKKVLYSKFNMNDISNGNCSHTQNFQHEELRRIP